MKCERKCVQNGSLSPFSLINNTEIEKYKRDYELKKADYDKDVEFVRAEAELAFKLQVGLISFLRKF